MQELYTILSLAFLGSVVALFGGAVFLYSKWSDKIAKYSVPFAAGVLITTSLVGLIPEAVDTIGEGALTVVFFAFMLSYLTEALFLDLHHHDEGHGHSIKKGSIWLIILGDTIHNFVDGVAIAASYLINPGLGLITTISTFLHEVPHEIGDFGILLKAGWEKKKVMAVNILSASTTLLGALTVYYTSQSENVIGILISAAAGMFLYLGASDFLPGAVHGLRKRNALLAVMGGAAIIYTVFMLIPHSH